MKKIKKLFEFLSYIPVLFKLLWQLDKVFLFMAIGEMTIFTLIAYPPLFLTKYAFDSLANEVDFFEYTISIAGVLLLWLALNVLKSYFNDNIRISRGELLKGRLAIKFYSKCMDMDYELLADKDVLELKELAGQFVENRFSNTIWSMIAVLSQLITMISAVLILAMINLWVILFTVIGTVISSSIGLIFVHLNRNKDEELTKKNRELEYYFQTASDFSYGKDIRLFNISQKLCEKSDGIFDVINKLLKKKRTYADINGITNVFLHNFSQLIIYFLLGFSVIRYGLSLGSFSLALSTTALFRTSLSSISNTILYYTDSVRYIKYYEEFMSLENRFQKTGRKNICMLENNGFVIEFKNVSFKYPGQNDYALKNINVKFHSGEKISIVGENGSGKSTFVKLLMRLYDPTEGEILFNSVNIKNIKYDQYLALFATAFQDFKLFAVTMQENISSLSQTDEKSLVTAAEKADIHQRIMTLPEQYDTYLFKLFDENGVELSGGEQQKLAIARMYFKDTTQIMVFDEPTSALDPRAEYKLYLQFNELIGEKTAFYISHRLSSSQFCDKIMVLDHGNMIEFGTFNELINLKGIFAEMYFLQSEYYK